MRCQNCNRELCSVFPRFTLTASTTLFPRANSRLNLGPFLHFAPWNKPIHGLELFQFGTISPVLPTRANTLDRSRHFEPETFQNRRHYRDVWYSYKCHVIRLWLCTMACNLIDNAPLSAVVVTCSLLAIPTNGQRSSSRRNYNDRVSFSCNTGYKLRGSSSRTCQSTGQWSGTQPMCNSKWRVHYGMSSQCMDAYCDPQQLNSFLFPTRRKALHCCSFNSCILFYIDIVFDSDQSSCKRMLWLPCAWHN